MSSAPAAIGESIRGDCQTALAALERAETAPPLMVTREADLAERAIVRARDELIGRLRAAGQPSERQPLEELLDKLNVALSLVVGLEYPIGGIERERIKQAADYVRQLAG